MGFLEFAGGIASGIGSFISNSISKIGDAIGGVARKFVDIVARLPEINVGKIWKIFDSVSKVIHAVTEILGINSEDETEVLGAKVEQTEKTVDDFTDAEEYINYLKKEVKLDQERFNKMTMEEKMGCKAVGLELETKAIEEKIGGLSISAECLATLAKINAAGGKEINAQQLLDVVKGLKAAGITDLNDVVDYFEGSGTSDRIKTGNALKEVMGEKAEERIDEIKECVRKYEED